MARALIIGGAGFIGSHLVDVIRKEGGEIWIYDNFSTGRRGFLPDDPAVHVVEGDILDTERLSRAVQESRPETLYHLAAIHHIPTCERDPGRALRVNVEGTQSVITACNRQPIRRIVFASTGALYDPANTGALAEISPIKPQDIYGISKWAGEQLFQYKIFQTGGSAIIARLFNTVGRRETNSHVIPAIMAQLAVGERRIKLGNLHTRRDYVHVEDVAQALFVLGNREMDKPFDVFNIGSGRDFSVSDLVRLCSDVIAETVEIESTAELQRKFDRPTQLADLAKIRQIGGWKPERSLKQALSEIWEEIQERSNAD